MINFSHKNVEIKLCFVHIFSLSLSSFLFLWEGYPLNSCNHLLFILMISSFIKNRKFISEVFKTEFFLFLFTLFHFFFLLIILLIPCPFFIVSTNLLFFSALLKISYYLLVIKWILHVYCIAFCHTFSGRKWSIWYQTDPPVAVCVLNL